MRNKITKKKLYKNCKKSKMTKNIKRKSKKQ